jgi:hypothetical protein
MASNLALQLAAPSGAIVSAPNASIAIGLFASFSVRLDAHNFMFRKGLIVPILAKAGLHRHLDGTVAAPNKTIKDDTGDVAVDIPNPEYTRW